MFSFNRYRPGKYQVKIKKQIPTRSACNRPTLTIVHHYLTVRGTLILNGQSLFWRWTNSTQGRWTSGFVRRSIHILRCRTSAVRGGQKTVCICILHTSTQVIWMGKCWGTRFRYYRKDRGGRCREDWTGTSGTAQICEKNMGTIGREAGFTGNTKSLIRCRTEIVSGAFF